MRDGTPAQRREEISETALFGQNRVGARSASAPSEVRARMGREDDDGRLRGTGHEMVDELSPVTVGQPQIEYDGVEPNLCGCLARFGDRPGNGGTLKIVMGIEREAQRLHEHIMVVNEEHWSRHPLILGNGRSPGKKLA